MAERGTVLGMEQTLGQRLTQQQLRFVRLLEMNAPELEEAVARELEDNPALETVDAVDGEGETPAGQSDYRVRYTPVTGMAGEDYDRQALIRDDTTSMYDELYRQLSERELRPEVELAARYIVGNLDSSGYLRRSAAQICTDILIEQGADLPIGDVEEALHIVQGLEPPGLGAHDLRETLMLQLAAREASEERDDALEILRDHFTAFSMKHQHRIVSGMKVGRERVERAVALILKLNPKPGAALGSDSGSAQPLIPDAILEKEGGRLSVTLGSRIPELTVSASFEGALAKRGRKRAPGQEFILSRRNDARDFIKTVSQRQETLLNVVSAIVDLQRKYFLTEDVGDLKPMMIKDIEAVTGYDASVISRSTNGKYLATPWGIYPLRHFFSDSLGSEEAGEGFTNRELETVLKELVEGEDKRRPLSDEALREAMSAKGYEISRRTVAKYRDRLKIPVARLRKIF